MGIGPHHQDALQSGRGGQQMALIGLRLGIGKVEVDIVGRGQNLLESRAFIGRARGHHQGGAGQQARPPLPELALYLVS